jgi:hypothetical protein
MAADEGPLTASGSLGRVVLRLVVGSLLVAGAAACVALLGGGFSDVDWKIIATSTLLALVSAVVAAAADRIERIAGHPQVSDECERLRALARTARSA